MMIAEPLIVYRWLKEINQLLHGVNAHIASYRQVVFQKEFGQLGTTTVIQDRFFAKVSTSSYVTQK
jgi:hypothetical protein